MRDDIWENLITRHSHAEPDLETLAPASDHLHLRSKSIRWDNLAFPLDDAIRRDPYPIPTTKSREGYYGQNHFDFWESGLRDCHLLMDCARKYSVDVRSYLDVGCASGRVLRHVACQFEGIKVYGCDINRRHIDWINRFLSKGIIAFQNHSLPHLNLPDESLDVVSAYSVFTHIEVWDTAWLLEIARVLRPGGIAWVTFHSEVTWAEMKPGWPLYDALAKFPDFSEPRAQELPSDMVAFRMKSDRSYTSNVFYKTSYIKDVWARIMPIREIRHRFPGYQDVIIFQKS